MTRQEFLPVAVLALALAGVTALGVSKFSTTPVHAQTTAVQNTQPERSESATSTKEGVEKPETAVEAAADKNLPGGGHQDKGQADHQFEGIE